MSDPQFCDILPHIAADGIPRILSPRVP